MTENHFEQLNLQEAERKRIADDLHDTTVQELVALSQQLELVNLYFDKDPGQAKRELSTARKEIKTIIGGIRETIYDLRPMTFDDIGWDAAIERVRQKADEMSNLRVAFRVDSFPELDRVYQITIYRILREAVNNVLLHAQATALTVDLHKIGDVLVLNVSDNGVGLEGQTPEQADDGFHHFGLIFMKENAALLNGDLTIQSSKNGTDITVTIPYVNK